MIPDTKSTYIRDENSRSRVTHIKRADVIAMMGKGFSQ